MPHNDVTDAGTAAGTRLPQFTLHSCDRCGPGVQAIWLVTVGQGNLTFCGSCYRKYLAARADAVLTQ